jgi:hypothetical protein
MFGGVAITAFVFMQNLEINLYNELQTGNESSSKI